MELIFYTIKFHPSIFFKLIYIILVWCIRCWRQNYYKGLNSIYNLSRKLQVLKNINIYYLYWLRKYGVDVNKENDTLCIPIRGSISCHLLHFGFNQSTVVWHWEKTTFWKVFHTLSFVINIWYCELWSSWLFS